MRLTIGLMACLLFVAAEDKTKDKPAGADPLTGTWKVESLVADGQEREEAKGSTFVFQDGKLSWKSERGERNWKYKLDTSKKPATIDLTVVGGNRDGTQTKGIFEVKGDDLKMNVTYMPDVDRPKDFSNSDGGLALITLKRDAGGKAEGKVETKPK